MPLDRVVLLTYDTTDLVFDDILMVGVEIRVGGLAELYTAEHGDLE